MGLNTAVVGDVCDPEWVGFVDFDEDSLSLFHSRPETAEYGVDIRELPFLNI